MKKARILIADDHTLFRHHVKRLLRSIKAWEICFVGRTGLEAVAQAGALKPGVAIIDSEIPELGWLEAARWIFKCSPRTSILILSMEYSEHLVRKIVAAGVQGYLVKANIERDLIVAVKALASHKPFFPPRPARLIPNRVCAARLPTKSPDVCGDELTPRERRLIELLAEGKPLRTAAIALGLGFAKAESDRDKIMRRLDLHTSTDLVRYVVRTQPVGN